MTKAVRDNKKSFTKVFVQNLPKFTLRQKGKKQFITLQGSTVVCVCGDLLIGSLLTALLVC